MGPFCFSMFRHQLFRIFRYLYSFSAPKRGVQSIPRGAALLLVFFSSQTDKISLNFDDCFDFFDIFVGEPTAHGPTGPRARGPTSWATKSGAGRAPTAQGPTGTRARVPTSWATKSGVGRAPTAHGPTDPRAHELCYQIWSWPRTDLSRNNIEDPYSKAV